MFKRIIAVSMVLLGTPALATVTAFTDRASFEAAAGPLITESFNGVGSDTSFINRGLAFTGFSVRANDPLGQWPGFNFVDVPGFDPSITPASYSVDGTTLVNFTVGSSASATLTFNRPVTAVGFDTRRMQNIEGLIEISVAGETLAPPILPLFLGYVSATPFTTLTFLGVPTAEFGDGFSMDNLSFSSTAVPEPQSWAMLIAGFGLVGATMRRRRVAMA